MSKTIYIHPDVHARLQNNDVIMVPDYIRESLLEGQTYTISKFVPSMMRKQVRKPRSKKKRIQNKWSANPRNWVDVNVAYLVDDSKPFLRPEPIKLPVITNLPYFQTTGSLPIGLERAAAMIYGGVEGI